MVVPLTAYFDASGTEPDRPVWAIGGWIAEVDQWTQLKKDWRRMLDEAPFRPDVKYEDRIFHAAELESIVGRYSGWTKDEKQEFQNRAYGIIEDYQLVPVASAVVKGDFEALKIRFERFPHGHGGNYFLHTFHDVMKNVHNWLDTQRWEVNVHYIFESGQLGDGAIQDELRRISNDPIERKLYRLRDWSFAGKELLPLQTADVWAYESYKQMVNRNLSGSLRDVRYPYRRLARSDFEKYQTYYNRENLLELLKTYRELEQKEGRSGDKSSSDGDP